MEEKLREADMLDPNPDIHALFCHYNSLYFHGSLGDCVVPWSTSLITRGAGDCHFQLKGGYEIRISAALLKIRSAAGLKNTLLHEMIHAYLWIEDRNKDRSDHGSDFRRLVDEINCSSIDDHQRPASGYNITEFHAEVDSYRVHHWICELCGNLMKRAIDTEPSANDCIEKIKHDGPCGNSSCNWHRHEKSCSGRYSKVEEPAGYVYNERGLKGEHKHHEDKESTLMSGNNAKKMHEAVEIKDKSDAKKSKTIKSFSVHEANQELDNSSGNALKKDRNCEDLEEPDLKTRNPAVPKQMAAGASSPMTRKKRKCTAVLRNKSGKHNNVYTVIIEWLGWYADEEGDKEIQQLINKRTERRKKQKLLKNFKGNVLEHESIK